MHLISVNMLTSKKRSVNMITSQCKYIYIRSGLPWCRLVRPIEEEYMVSVNTDRTNYLSLALDARKTIKALRQASETGNESDELKGAIEDTVESLRALSTGALLFARLHPQFPYQHYEQVKTLEEVQSAMKEEHLADRLSELNRTADPGHREELIKLAIAFFSALENRALQRYNTSASSAFGR
jgi:hypothetical protein